MAIIQIKILIIDDSKLLCTLIKEILISENYSVEVEYNGFNSIEVSKKIQPHLILLDLILNGIDGYTICQQLKAEPTLKDIPIVIVTSSTDEKSILKCFECGAVDYITKPFRPLELLARVKCHATNKLLSNEINKTILALEYSVKANHDLAIRDSLTSLYNRRYISEKVAQIYKSHDYNEADYLLLIDIDNFKEVNDTYGHNMGDEVLKTISDIIVKNSPANSIIGRWGGEEIIILLHNCFEVSLLAKSIVDCVAQHYFSSPNCDFNKTLTMGCVHIDYSNKFEDFIGFADKALYYGKNHGKNQVVFWDDVKDNI